MPHRMLATKNIITRTKKQHSRSQDSSSLARQDPCEDRSTQRRKLGGSGARFIPSRTSSTNKPRDDREGATFASASDFFRVLRVVQWLSSSKTKGTAEDNSQDEGVKADQEKTASSALDVSGRAFGKELQAELARVRQGQQLNTTLSRNGYRQEGLSLRQLAQLRSPKQGLSCYTPTPKTPSSTSWETGPSKPSLSPSCSTSTLPCSPPPSPPRSTRGQLPPRAPVTGRRGPGGAQNCANQAGKRPGGRSVWRGEPARKMGGDVVATKA